MCYQKKFLSVVLTLVFLFGVCFYVFAASYVGSRNTKRFHEADCTWAGKIHQENKIYFEAREQAMKAGYVPCKICQP